VSGPIEPPGPEGEGPVGLLLTRDLFFTSKVTGTARALGRSVLTAGNAALAAALIERHGPPVIFLDLAAGELTGPAAIAEYRRMAPAGAALVAFGSHVDAEALAAARAAGCDEVMPRSRFSAELPAIVARHLGGG
jgi:CheY-like chemotaxis protein